MHPDGIPRSLQLVVETPPAFPGAYLGPIVSMRGAASAEPNRVVNLLYLLRHGAGTIWRTPPRPHPLCDEAEGTGRARGDSGSALVSGPLHPSIEKVEGIDRAAGSSIWAAAASPAHVVEPPACGARSSSPSRSMYDGVTQPVDRPTSRARSGGSRVTNLRNLFPQVARNNPGSCGSRLCGLPLTARTTGLMIREEDETTSIGGGGTGARETG